MSTTSPYRVGKTRIRLAELLNDAIPTAVFEPHQIDSQIPVFATPQWDCCSWYAEGKDKVTGLNVHVACWETMKRCVKFGIDARLDGPSSWEVSSKEITK